MVDIVSVDNLDLACEAYKILKAIPLLSTLKTCSQKFCIFHWKVRFLRFGASFVDDEYDFEDDLQNNSEWIYPDGW